MSSSVRGRLRRAAVVAMIVFGSALPGSAPAVAAQVPAFPGSLPPTSSSVQVNGRGEFKDLSISVNQTQDLVSQAVSLSWLWPGKQTGFDALKHYLTNYLQIMQCWGDPVTSAGTTPEQAANYVDANPGPPREQCEFGGGAFVQSLLNTLIGNSFSRLAYPIATGHTPAHNNEEAVDRYSAPYLSVNQKVFPGETESGDIPFRAANGDVVEHSTAPIQPNAIGYRAYAYSNAYYDQTTTNESVANRVWPDGTGGATFQAQNSFDANGLGCGATALAPATGLNHCWLVIVPRGELDSDGKPYDLVANQNAPFGSPLSSQMWKNRIAVPLGFRPVQTACSSADEIQTTGSELAAAAVLSWQAKLCGSGRTFNFSNADEQIARGQLAQGSTSLAYISDPVPGDVAAKPITYAPASVSGVTFGFVWDKFVRVGEFETRPGKPLDAVNLTPRLVAKLLTFSYRSANAARIGPVGVDRSPPPEQYSWLETNPDALAADPEFIAVNPSLNKLVSSTGDAITTVQVEFNGSDAAKRLWQWIMADKAAAKWLAGAPDEYGMQVDPNYSTTPAINSTGVGFDPNIRNFPNSDPWQGIPSATEKADPNQPTLTMLDIRPYSTGLADTARNVSVGNTLQRATFWCVPSGFNSGCDIPSWRGPAVVPVVPGSRSLMGFSDTASAARYGITPARLQNAAGKFVGPTDAAMTAAATKLDPTGVEGVSQPSLTNTDPAAYPLTLVTYAAVTTDTLTTTQCANYAALVAYSASNGQVRGESAGLLPAGYVPLPPTLLQQSVTAARTIAACAKLPPPPVVADGSQQPEASPAQTPTRSQVVPAAVAAPGTAVTPASVSLSAKSAGRGTTPADPWGLSYAIPAAFAIGLLGLLAGPLFRLRRRRRPTGS